MLLLKQKNKGAKVQKIKDFCQTHDVGISLTIWVLLGIIIMLIM